jgi:hypothetical protein
MNNQRHSESEIMQPAEIVTAAAVSRADGLRRRFISPISDPARCLPELARGNPDGNAPCQATIALHHGGALDRQDPNHEITAAEWNGR